MSNTISPELAARRTAAAAILTDYHVETALAPLSRPPDAALWAGRLAAALAMLLDGLADDQDDQADDDQADDYNYTCSTCGALIGVFIGHGDGWHHYRGEGTAASPVELFDAGHEATIGGV